MFSYNFESDNSISYTIIDFNGMEWAMRKKGIPDCLVRSVMSLYEGAKTRVRVDSDLSEEFVAKVGIHQGSVLSPFLYLW